MRSKRYAPLPATLGSVVARMTAGLPRPRRDGRLARTPSPATGRATMVRRAGVGTAVLVVFSVFTAAAQATAPGDAGAIAFQRYLGPDNSQGSIFMISPDGTGERQLTSSPPGLTDRFPDVGPHSERIAFQRCGDFCHVMTVKADGTGLQALTTMCAPGQIPPACTDDSYPAYSPNGQHIAFVRVSGHLDEETGQPDHVAIWLMHRSGKAPRVVTHPQSLLYEDGEPQWAPDGKRIVFVRVDLSRGIGAIFTVRPNGHELQQITPWELDAGDGPDISPDGTRITFARDGIAGLPDVWTMNTDGSDVRRVTSNALWDSGPDWGAR